MYDQLSVSHPAVKFLKVDIDNEELEGTVRAAGISSVVCTRFLALETPTRSSSQLDR